MPAGLAQTLWPQLLTKTLSSSTLIPLQFVVFALGDRSYGDLFCAAGRKWAIRLLQLGATLWEDCPIGYGDDLTPNGGCFVDLDDWWSTHVMPILQRKQAEVPELVQQEGEQNNDRGNIHDCNDKYGSDTTKRGVLPYKVNIHPPSSTQNQGQEDGTERPAEWRHETYRQSYLTFFQQLQPTAAYPYRSPYGQHTLQRVQPTRDDLSASSSSSSMSLLQSKVTCNDRLTHKDWHQNTRHLRLQVTTTVSAALSGNENRWDETKKKENPPSRGGFDQKLPYRAGDVAVVIPSNSPEKVQRFLDVLPHSLWEIADNPLDIDCLAASRSDITSQTGHNLLQSLVSCSFWPQHCTLRGLLTYCADIAALPEREDLRALVAYCDTEHHPHGRDQQAKLIGLSEPTEAALYADYILREKRSWAEVLYDFDSIRGFDTVDGDTGKSSLTIEALLTLLSPIRPREFSIASSPTEEMARQVTTNGESGHCGFDLELCVAVVEGKTPLGRSYHGLCSNYLATRSVSGVGGSGTNGDSSSTVLLWIRPGTFDGLPVDYQFLPDNDTTVLSSGTMSIPPLLCIGAGTGVAPLRSLIREREAVRQLCLSRQLGSPSVVTKDTDKPSDPQDDDSLDDYENILIFGSRKSDMDYYYETEWKQLEECRPGCLRVLTAFSQDQWHKIYVQQVLKKQWRQQNESSSTPPPTEESERPPKHSHNWLYRHLVEHQGALYVAGNPSMARAVKEEVLEALVDSSSTTTAEKMTAAQAKKFLARLNRLGRFRVEAWS